MHSPRFLVPILAICFLGPLRLGAADFRDDPLPSAPTLPRDQFAPPTATSILAPPPLFPDLVEEASRPDEAEAGGQPSQPSPHDHSTKSPHGRWPSKPDSSQSHPHQSYASGRTPPSAQGGHGGPRRLQKLQRKLGLSPDQVAMIKPIIQRAGRQLRALRENPGLAKSEKRYYARQIFVSSFRQIRPYLTARQLRKWRQLREEQRTTSARA